MAASGTYLAIRALGLDQHMSWAVIWSSKGSRPTSGMSGTRSMQLVRLLTPGNGTKEEAVEKRRAA